MTHNTTAGGSEIQCLIKHSRVARRAPTRERGGEYPPEGNDDVAIASSRERRRTFPLRQAFPSKVFDVFPPVLRAVSRAVFQSRTRSTGKKTIKTRPTQGRERKERGRRRWGKRGGLKKKEYFVSFPFERGGKIGERYRGTRMAGSPFLEP